MEDDATRDRVRALVRESAGEGPHLKKRRKRPRAS
jgi:hypothetical protein